MEVDPQIEKLLKRLASDGDDDLRPLWSHISDCYVHHDCCKALQLFAAAQGAVQLGCKARRERKPDSECPYRQTEEWPLEPHDLLRMAWMSGYNAEDLASRARQAESKVYDAYKELADLRQVSEALMLDIEALRPTSDPQDMESIKQRSVKIEKRIRNLHGTILTGAVTRRVKIEKGEIDPYAHLLR